MEQAIAEYGAGDEEAAYKTARNAYLDHFEYVEIPLRVRNEGLTLALEEKFAELRNEIEDGKPLDRRSRRSAPESARKDMDDVERELREPGSQRR